MQINNSQRGQNSKQTIKMSTSCNLSVTLTTPTYHSLYSLQSDTTSITVLILATIIPVQLLCMIGFCVYTRCRASLAIQPQQKQSKYKNVKKQDENMKKRAKSKNIQNNQISRTMGMNNNIQQQQQPSRLKRITNGCRTLITKFQICLFPWTSKNRIIFFSVIIILTIISSVITLSIAILASQQALTRQFPTAQCTLNQTVNNFVKGTNQWIGLSYMVPNLTKLQLNLNTRVKATKNSITSLVLNSTNTTFPIGFPNATRIFDTITNTNIIATSVQSYIDASLRQWLYRNSTLSSTYIFPICQTNTTSNIPHPLNDGQTIELNYMSSICNNLTNEVNSLVLNGKYVDQLLVLTNAVEGGKININSNLSAMNGTLATTALRSNEYQQQLSKSGIDVSGLRVIPFALIGLQGFMLLVVLVYISCQFYRLNKYTVKQNQQQHYKQKSERQLKYKQNNKQKNPNMLTIDQQNISISDPSQLSPSQIQIKKQAKIKQIMRVGLFSNSKTTHLINILYLLVIFAIGFCTIFYTVSINNGTNFCSSFNNVINGQKKLTDIPQLSSIQKELLSPIKNCQANSLASSRLSATSSNTYFLQTTQTQTHLASIQKLYNISRTYNLTTPTNVLNSISLQQIQILKNYLLHMQTMPVKAPDFNIQTILNQLNTYTNGSNIQSRQSAQCGLSILRDQYVYNVVNCDYTLIDYIGENLVTQPRCLQIPTWEGSGGTRDADLNDAQHTIQLNTTCTTIYDFFNGTNLNCFLGKRLNLLRTSSCNITASQYNRRLKNLINFSVQTASYTNSYLQNLRNYFGVYSVLSTNLTQFFNGVNTSAILSQFGTLSNNLINKTSCSYVNQAVKNVYSAYCPDSNRISMLLYDCYVWIFISFGLASFSWGLLVVWEIVMKIFAKLTKQQKLKQSKFSLVAVPQSSKPSKFYKNSMNKQKEVKKVRDKKQKNHKLQISQQTLKNEDHQQDQRIDYIKRLEIIQNQSPQNQQIQVDYLEVPRNHRALQQIKKSKKQSSQNSSSNHNTEEHKPQYEDHFQNHPTGKKLLHQQFSYQSNIQPEEQNKNEQIKQTEQKKINQRNNSQRNNNNNQVIQNQASGQIKIQIQNNFDKNQNSKLAINTKNNQKRINTYYKQNKATAKKKTIEFQQSFDDPKSKRVSTFFGNIIEQSVSKTIEQDSRMNDFSKQQIQRQRKVNSKAESRPQTDLMKYQKGRSINKITKQGRQNERLKVIQLGEMLRDSTQFELPKMIDKQIKKKDEKQISS